MEDSKFVVFKKDEWEEFVRDMVRAPVDMMVPARVPDAHVIREQDVFAPGVLFTYGAAVQTAIEVIDESPASVPKHLFDLRDHFFMAANSSAMSQRKVPD